MKVTAMDHIVVVVPDVEATVACPADLFGARGTSRGIYIRDPAGNTVELRSYPGTSLAS